MKYILQMIDMESLLLVHLLLIYKATPIYILVLRAQEVGNEPFWNKKKVEKM